MSSKRPKSPASNVVVGIVIVVLMIAVGVNDSVILKTESGRKVTVEIEKLFEEDRLYVDQLGK